MAATCPLLPCPADLHRALARHHKMRIRDACYVMRAALLCVPRAPAALPLSQ